MPDKPCQTVSDYPCGCRVVRVPSEYRNKQDVFLIQFCTMHSRAERMAYTLKVTLRFVESEDIECGGLRTDYAAMMRDALPVGG